MILCTNIANSTGATAWGFTSFMGFVWKSKKNQLLNYKRAWTSREKDGGAMPSVNPKKIYMRPYNGKAPSRYRPFN
jgi:hypothetical protein